jgi:hypothetical protein
MYLWRGLAVAVLKLEVRELINEMFIDIMKYGLYRRNCPGKIDGEKT